MSKVLSQDEGKVAEALITGVGQDIASALLSTKLRDSILVFLLEILSSECSALCQTGDSSSIFRRISITALKGHWWENFITELSSKAPTLLHILLTLVSFNDQRNSNKVGAAHYPGVCTAVAILLKERNKNMSGLQSLVSALMYACHCEKQVNM